MYVITDRLRGSELFAMETDRLRLSVLKRSAYKPVTDYLVRNRLFHKQWAQTHDDSYFTERVQKDYLRYAEKYRGHTHHCLSAAFAMHDTFLRKGDMHLTDFSEYIK